MRAFHRRLAELGLAATHRFGFALAGGYAVSEHGMGDRLSVDVDLFTDVVDPDSFRAAGDQLRAAYEYEGLVVEVNRVGPVFLDLRVTDERTGESSDVQLGANFREFPPRVLSVGPVLDPRDAVAGKMSALWSRSEARDYIDIDTVISSGRFDREEVLALADAQEALPLDRAMLAERFRGARRHPAEVYALYAVDAARRAEIVERFARWADEIDPDRS